MVSVVSVRIGTLASRGREQSSCAHYVRLWRVETGVCHVAKWACTVAPIRLYPIESTRAGAGGASAFALRSRTLSRLGLTLSQGTRRSTYRGFASTYSTYTNMHDRLRDRDSRHIFQHVLVPRRPLCFRPRRPARSRRSHARTARPCTPSRPCS